MARRKTAYPALPRPPIGTYDPSIDASERAAGRGYHDLQLDTQRQNTRGAADLQIQLGDIKRNRDYGLADILRQRTRLGEDVNTQGGQIEQGYQRGLADILTQRQAVGRNYAEMGARQGENANAAGVGDGGALAQSLAKRTANMGIDTHALDVQQARLGENHTQAVQQLDQSRVRSIEDIGTAQDRLVAQYGTGQSSYQHGTNGWADAWLAKNPGKQLPGGPTDQGTEGLRVALGYQRGVEDRSTNLQRAGREYNAYQQDLVPTRYYGAAGLTPYAPPRKVRRR